MRPLLCLACACLLTGCRRQEEAPPPPRAAAPLKAPRSPPLRLEEQEPDDYQHAMAIPPRAVVSGSIAPPRPRVADDDWYRVEAQKTLALRIDLKQVGDAPLDAWLELYDRDRNRLLRVHAGGEDPGVIPAAACVQACFVKVSGTAAARYELTVLGDDPLPGQELEPNDRAVDATELQPGKPMTGTYLSADDEDWYRLAIPAVAPGEYLRVEVTAVAGVRHELQIRALADGALLASMRGGALGEALLARDLSLHLGEPAADAGAAAAGGGLAAPDAGLAAAGAGPAAPDAGGPGAEDAATLAQAGGGSADAGPAAGAADAAPPSVPPAPPPAPGGYYLVLKPAPAARGRRAAAPLSPYTLTATVEAGPPDLEQEPNDDPQHATPVQTTATGYLAPAGDQDWFRVHTDAKAVLRVEVSGLPRADLELSVFGPAPSPGEKPPLLARANEGGPKEGELLPAVGLPAGDSYVLVQAALRDLDGRRVRDGEDPQTPYRLLLTLSPDDGSTEREPNNDLATAQTLALPASVKGWIWPRKDVDVFRFHVGAGHAPVNIVLPAVRGMDLALRLLEVHGAQAEVIGSSDSSRGEGEEKLLSVPLKEGDYAVEVSSPRNKDASATQAYTLSIE